MRNDSVEVCRMLIKYDKGFWEDILTLITSKLTQSNQIYLALFISLSVSSWKERQKQLESKLKGLILIRLQTTEGMLKKTNYTIHQNLKEFLETISQLNLKHLFGFFLCCFLFNNFIFFLLLLIVVRWLRMHLHWEQDCRHSFRYTFC